MMLLAFHLFVCLWASGLGVADSSPPASQLTVKTTTGSFTGLQNPDYKNVREFRNIPFALPPTGDRRWQAPVPVPASRSLHRFSRRFPPPCAQYMTSHPSLWNVDMPDFQLRLDGQSSTPGASAQTSSEDCLSLAVWTPFDVRADASLPVILFMPGGSFVGGGINIPYQNPAPWVSRSQAHIAVIAQYRLGIYGFPNAAGLKGADNNVAIQDVRAALEWVYNNIDAFGGDRRRITLWGHSAGGVVADMASWAHYDDVLAAGMWLMSGTGMAPPPDDDLGHSNFTFVAKNLGCDFPGDAAAELDCMRQVPATLLANFIGQYADNRTSPGLTFKPRADGEVVMANYTARAEAGLLPRIPALVSTTSNEFSSLVRYPEDNLAAGPNKTEVDKGTVGFNCMVSNTTQARARWGLPTWRYEFAGSYSSLGPRDWMGAFHGIDVPLIFGTYARRFKDEGGKKFRADAPESLEQTRVSEALQDFALAFISDPSGGGLRRMGWLPQTATAAQGGGPLMRFASKGRVAVNVSSADVDDSCLHGVPWNSSP